MDASIVSIIFSFEQQSKPRGCKMANRDPRNLSAAFSMIKIQKMVSLPEMDASFFSFEQQSTPRG